MSVEFVWFTLASDIKYFNLPGVVISMIECQNWSDESDKKAGS